MDDSLKNYRWVQWQHNNHKLNFFLLHKKICTPMGHRIFFFFRVIYFFILVLLISSKTILHISIRDLNYK